MTDLGPDDSDTASVATASFNFTIAGSYYVCYKLYGASEYTQVGSLNFTVVGVAPTAWTDDGTVQTMSTETVTMSFGSGLKLSAGYDAAKVVYVEGTCADEPAGGTSEVTDLSNSDADGVTTANASFVFTRAGQYYVCYRPYLGEYTQLSSAMITVIGVAPSNYSDSGALFTAVSTPFAMFGGSGQSQVPGDDSAKIVAASEPCSDTAAGGSVAVTNLGPANTDGTTSATANFTFTVAGVYKVCYQVRRQGAFAQVGLQNFTVLGVMPTAYTDDGALFTDSTETLSFTGGTGLKLASGYDSAIVVASSGTCAATLDYVMAGGTSPVTDLGPDDADGATTATANFSFTIAGTYIVCYQVYRGTYTQALAAAR